jgi:hypothetical protein
MSADPRDIDPASLRDGDRVEVFILDAWRAAVVREEDGRLVVLIDGWHDDLVLTSGLQTPIRFRRRLDG